MKIKTKKQMNLPQLIEWAWENDVRNKGFESERTSRVYFDYDGYLSCTRAMEPTDTFTVDVEEEITEDTKFKSLVKVTEAKNVFAHFDASINGVKHDTVVEIYALLNGKLESIWTKDKGLVE